MSNNLAETRAAVINRLHAEFCKELLSNLAKAVEIGRLLTEQKKELDHGEWIPWIKANLKVNRQQAQKYMCAYKNRKALEVNVHSGGHFTLNNIPQLLAKSAEEKAGPGQHLQPLIPMGHSGVGRLQYVYDNGVQELIEAYEGRQISLRMADFLAHLEAENQREEIPKFVVGKDKVIVMPATEEMLLKQQRKEQMMAVVIENDGLNEFQRAFKKVWLKLVRKFQKEYPGDYGYGEMWRLAEAVVIRVNAPQQEVPRNPS